MGALINQPEQQLHAQAAAPAAPKMMAHPGAGADAKDEEYAQEDYEELMKESAEKRAADSKTITEKESQKAGLEGDLDTAKKDKKATSTDLMALGEYVASLHGSCDFLLENFEVCWPQPCNTFRMM